MGTASTFVAIPWDMTPVHAFANLLRTTQGLPPNPPAPNNRDIPQALGIMGNVDGLPVVPPNHAPEVTPANMPQSGASGVVSTVGMLKKGQCYFCSSSGDDLSPVPVDPTRADVKLCLPCGRAVPLNFTPQLMVTFLPDGAPEGMIPLSLTIVDPHLIVALSGHNTMNELIMSGPLNELVTLSGYTNFHGQISWNPQHLVIAATLASSLLPSYSEDFPSPHHSSTSSINTGEYQDLYDAMDAANAENANGASTSTTPAKKKRVSPLATPATPNLTTPAAATAPPRRSSRGAANTATVSNLIANAGKLAKQLFVTPEPEPTDKALEDDDPMDIDK